MHPSSHNAKKTPSSPHLVRRAPDGRAGEDPAGAGGILTGGTGPFSDRGPSRPRSAGVLFYVGITALDNRRYKRLIFLMPMAGSLLASP